MNEWSTIRKLMWLKRFKGGGGPSWAWETLTGEAPLTLLSAVHHAIHSLTQTGKCTQPSVDYLATVTQTGVCEQASTPTPSAPQNIVCNNGAIKVSRNLCDVVSANIAVGKYINNAGVETADTANFYYSTYIPVTPGGTYTMAASSSIWYFSVMQYDGSKNFLRRTVWGATNTPVGTEKTFDVGADCAYILFGSNMKKATISEADVLAVSWMLTETATALDYRPYGEVYMDGTPESIVDAFGNTASAVNLFGVGEYADTQEFLTGAVTHKVGIKVLTGDNTKDGTWGTSGGASNLYSLTIADSSTSNTFSPISTHFVGILGSVGYASIQDGQFKHGSNANTYYFKDTSSEDVTTFKSKIAAQYAAGTPVIVLYPLATATTESVPGQMLAKEPLTVTAEVTVPTLVTTTAAVSTPDPYHPLPVWCNNGVLKLSPNLLDPSTSNIYIQQHYNASGAIISNSINNWRSGRIPVIGGKTYAFYGRKKTDNTISAYNRINWYEADGTHIAPRPSYTVNTVTIATAPSNAAFAGLSSSAYDSDAAITRATFDEFNWMFAEANAEIQYIPYGAVYADGTPEVLTVSGKNLISNTPDGQGTYVTPSATVRNRVYKVFPELTSGQTYTVSIGGDSQFEMIIQYRINASNYGNIGGWTREPVTFTADANRSYGLAIRKGDANITPTDFTGTLQLEIGEAATEYQPFTPQTATVENLFAVGDYKDTQEIISGDITRKTWVVAFDGTENWAVYDGVYYVYTADLGKPGAATGGAYAPFATRFKAVSSGFNNLQDGEIEYAGDTSIELVCSDAADLTAFKALLAEWYADGNPLIVVYPAPDRTETTTAQHLSTVEGTNVVDVVSNVDPVELEVEYAKSNS